MREPLPDTADVEITAADFARAQPFRTSENSCYECVVSQAFKRHFRAAASRVGYDGAWIYSRAPLIRHAFPPGTKSALYKWDDKRMSGVIVAFDAGDDAKLARLLPVTVHVRRVE